MPKRYNSNIPIKLPWLRAKKVVTTLCLLTCFTTPNVLSTTNDLGTEVAVVYNSKVPESKLVAEYYAKARHVPTNHLIGLDLPTSEAIDRHTFTTMLQQPLIRQLEARGLWKVVSTVGETTDPPKLKWRVAESKIRYLVLCYGVPLKITPSQDIQEPGIENLRVELRRNEAAVDNELALLPFAPSGYSLTAFVPNRFFTTTNRNLLHPTNGILMVTRLDGPNAQIAMRLVDKALEAERSGLWGNAYFDLRGITSGGYAKGDEWIKTASKIAQICGFEVWIDTNSTTFPVSYPMSHIALYAGWYDETVSGPFTLDAVEFMPGAFAYHLHSNNGASLRQTNLWAPGLLLKGATTTMASVYEPYLDATPDLGVFFARFMLLGFTYGEAAYAAIPCLSWQTTVIGDPLYRPFGQNLEKLRQDLENSQSKLLEWLYLHQLNMNLIQKLPLQQGVDYLNQIELSKQSPVLMEKLARLYLQLGKPYSAINAFKKALSLNPSPNQRIRIALDLAELLSAQQRPEEATDVYLDLIKSDLPKPISEAILTKAMPLITKYAPDRLPTISVQQNPANTNR